MRAALYDVDHLLQTGGGVIARRHHPELAPTLHRLVQSGRLRRVLPGVYVETRIVEHPLTRIRALAAWDPDAVITGDAAAKLTFWPELHLSVLGAATRWQRQSQPGYTFSRRRVPPELVVSAFGLRCTAPALTALDLCLSRGGDAIDAALRSRLTNLALIQEALRLTPERRGNGDRRALLLDSRAEPWSAAERLGHRLLRSEGISGWVGNYPLPLLGQLYLLDIAFPAQMLAVEIDGRAYHAGAAAFEGDRWRQNNIVLAGWRVLRFTWLMLTEQPQIVLAVIRRALQESSATHG